MFNNRRFAESLSKSSSHQQCFQVVKEGDFLSLQSKGEKFARLNKGLCKNVSPLLEEGFETRIYAYVLTNDLQKATSISTPSPFLIEINICGKISDSKKVASILSRARIFLQYPRFDQKRWMYRNPQLLPVGRTFSYGIPEETRVTSDAVAKPSSSQGAEEDDPRGNESRVVESILDSLSHRVGSQDLMTDIRIGNIKSTLLT